MIEFLIDWLRAIWVILVESGPYLLVGFVIAGFIKVLVPEEKVFRHLGKDDFKSVFVASCCGIPIPLCSCSVIPTAMALRRSGASKGATASFLISTPETGVDSIGVTWALMDPIMTVTRPLAALLTALGCGTFVNFLVRRGWAGKAPQDIVASEARVACCTQEPAGEAGAGSQRQGAVDRDTDREPDHDHDHDHDHDDHDHEHVARGGGFVTTVKEAFRYAFGPSMADLTPWFILGFLVSGLITMLVPDDFFREVALPTWVAMVAMLFVGAPLYICATASTPVAAALIAKGLEPGAALVLLLAGPATHMATMFVVRNFLGGRVLAVYLTSIAAFSLAFGWIVNVVYRVLDVDPVTTVKPIEEMGYGLDTFSGWCGLVLLVLLILSSIQIRLLSAFGARLRAWFRPVGIDPTSRFSKVVLSLVVLALYGSTAVSSLKPGETGFLLRFGAVQQTLTDPGMYLHLPYPIDAVEVVRDDEVRGLEFGFERVPRTAGAAAAAESERSRRGAISAEGEILTGNENLLNIEYATHYRVRDPYRFRFAVVDPEATIRALTEWVLRAHVGTKRTSDEMLVSAHHSLDRDIAAELQRELDALELGIEVVSFKLLSVHAPPQTHYAFRNVASEIERKEEQILSAEGQRTVRVTAAKARSFAIEQQAIADSISKVESAHGNVAAFKKLQGEWSQGPEVIRYLLQMRAAEDLYRKVRLVLLLGEGIDVVPIQPRKSGSPPIEGD